ncbi:MAG: polysaccharide deacetylase family sporulation protein PdaB [Firmicutes bacterium]|nr:polysaccharide deacetylase family sporulation protein PdaB [Bacillota bacterium]
MRLIYFYHLSAKAKIILTLFCTLFLIGSSVVYVQAEHRLKPTFEVKTDQKVLALTFDISWGTNTPTPVLDILKKHNVRATFFLSGPWVKKYPSIPQRIAADGHEIGSHGNEHINLSTVSKEKIREEIMLAHQSIQAVTGHTPNLIRTPNGDYNNQVISTANECGYRVIQWGTDSLDWKNPGVDAIVNRVLKRAHPGDIILMHASDTCKQTVDALPRIIEGLREQGYQFVTVSELLQLEQNQINSR